MRAIVGSKTSENIDVKVTQTSDLVLIKKMWLEDLILAFSESDVGKLKSQIMNSSINSQWINRLVDLLRHTPKTTKTGSPPIDFYLENRISSNIFFDLYDNNDFNQVLKMRKSRVKSNESRDDVFSRLFEPLASTAKKLVLVDPYLTSEMLNDRSGAYWLIQKHIDAGISSIDILSTYERNDLDIQSHLRKSIKKNLHLNENMYIRMTLLKNTTYIKDQRKITKNSGEHGRHCRYIYGPEQISPVIELEQGTVMFNQERLVSSKGIFALDFEHIDTAKDRENVYRVSPMKANFRLVA